MQPFDVPLPQTVIIISFDYKHNTATFTTIVTNMSTKTDDNLFKQNVTVTAETLSKSSHSHDEDMEHEHSQSYGTY